MTKPIMAAKSAIRPHVEATNRAWHCVAEAEHTLPHALGPGYLGARVKDMRAGDTFDIRHESHHYLVRGYVLDVDKDAGIIAYAILEVVDLTQIEAIQYDWADATVKSVRGGWAVIREDGHVLKSGFGTEAAATEWLGAKRQLAAAGKVA